MAKQMYNATMQQFSGKILPHWDPRAKKVERVMERLIPSSGLTTTRWEVHVIDSPEMNAFVIPGGKVFVFTGLFRVCRDEDSLAVVLGHEIAHNLAHHVGERLSRGFIAMGLLTVLEYTLGVPDFASGLLLELGFNRPGSRNQEV